MFEAMIIGHLIGDYLTQTDWLAMNKQKRTWRGMYACFLHCILYSLSMLATFSFVGMFSWKIFIIAFATHYPIDRYGLGEKWMALIGQTTIQSVFLIEDYKTREIRKGFVPLIYVMVDNTIHLVLMWILFKCFLN